MKTSVVVYTRNLILSVNLYGNISSLFALISILFLIANLSFCLEVVAHRFVTTPSKIVQSKVFVVYISKFMQRTIIRQAQKFEQWTSKVKRRNWASIQIPSNNFITVVSRN